MRFATYFLIGSPFLYFPFLLNVCSAIGFGARELKAVKMLQMLYIGRCSACWKLPAVMEWLEANVKEVIARVEVKDPCVEEYAAM